MRVRTFAVLCLLMAIYFVTTVATEVYIDDFVRPRSVFANLLLGTLLTSVAALAVNIDIPT